VGHEKLPTLRRQLRDRHPRKDRVVVEQHPHEDHLERLRHPRGGEHHEPVAEGGDHGRESTPEVARKVVPLRASADANSRMQLLAGKPRNLP
jgi:hypothetical protein